ncbi:UDP-N-acetylmuramate dehydrogenase [Parvularcula sp. LCG005]|uniref:UDP-N-acetylmuramate dehydrogenase n=1 Tax=Parvularcula sp. LCG005 TaxID=3078805 RepID=UPI002942786D|nr:UDP-N-acetylmuramate dehydrogenase [Parvularcula sp. LCG005]WOI52121.1 UDP-N-acetylmuramate dehydrogenase [Parvularcula sp. LCG005]
MTVRGKLIEGTDLAPYTWFRVGGPADRLFIPADQDDLAAFLADLPEDEPVMVIGVGSNLLVRDGGIRGTVIRLGPAFGKIDVVGTHITAGAGALDAMVAKRAAAAGIAGLEFYRGIPGTIGGALRMNAGAYGRETKDVLVHAVAIDRRGERHVFPAIDIGYAYRHCPLPEDLIFVEAVFEGTPDTPTDVTARMDDIMAKREASQPVRERTGGSTFKNPDPAQSDGRSSWQLIDSVGGRGRVVGDAQMSELHCNFMINRGQATARDLEGLGEGIRADVKAATGVELEWEIKRIGEAL